ncbi:MAG: hypothetical protein WC162_09845, partial [Sphaerochaetaceae bacterium]
MIKLLKRKFVFVAMLSSGLTLFILIITLNILSYYNMVNRLDNALYSMVSRDNEEMIEKTPNSLPDKNRGRAFSIEFDSSKNVKNVDVFMYPIMEEKQAIDLAKDAMMTGEE